MGQLQVHVRAASNTDIEEMHRIRMSVRENQLSDPGGVTAQDYQAMLAERGRGWVADVNGRIAGFAVADATRANVWALFVDPDFEGCGIGRQLHQTMMDWMFENGAAQVWLSTDPGTRAERFYQAAGWRRSGVEPSGEARYEMSCDTWRSREQRAQPQHGDAGITRLSD